MSILSESYLVTVRTTVLGDLSLAKARSASAASADGSTSCSLSRLRLFISLSRWTNRERSLRISSSVQRKPIAVQCCEM